MRLWFLDQVDLGDILDTQPSEIVKNGGKKGGGDLINDEHSLAALAVELDALDMLDKGYYGVPAILTHYYYDHTELIASFSNLNMLGIVHPIKLNLLLWLGSLNRVLVILLQIDYLDLMTVMAGLTASTLLPFY